MSKETSNEKSLAVVGEERTTLVRALGASFYPGAAEASIGMVLTYCQAAGLDPMTKPVHIVPMWDKAAKAMRDVIMPGIGMYRIIADRSGKYAGQDDAEYGPERQNWGISYPEWCKVTIYKLTPVGRVPYSAKVFWLEAYATGGRDSDAPNAMWRKRPYGQLEKCAESAALRKAFPEIGSQPTAEEMEGKMLEGTIVEAPVALSATAGTSRADQVKNALRSRMGVATPENVVEVEPVEPTPEFPAPAVDSVDEATVELLMDAVVKAQTPEDVAELVDDAIKMGLSDAVRLRMTQAAKTRISELRWKAEIGNAETAAAVKAIAARIETVGLPKIIIQKLLIEARGRYKDLAKNEKSGVPG